MRRTSLCASCSLPSETRLRWDELAQAGGGCGCSDDEASWDYFRRRRDEEKRQMQVAPPPWEDDTVTAAPSVVRYDMDRSVHPYLANDYPAPITIEWEHFLDGRTRLLGVGDERSRHA